MFLENLSYSNVNFKIKYKNTSYFHIDIKLSNVKELIFYSSRTLFYTQFYTSY